ncbi:hypothetical protein V8F06_000561 [Rhypophila decipiens]
MSGPPNKLSLDARAAELKEKLVRRKVGNRASPGRFVPHPLPQIPQQTTVDASANDIAALISSISSTIVDKHSQGQASGPNTQHTGNMNSQNGEGAWAETASSHQAEQASQRQPPKEYNIKGSANSNRSGTDQSNGGSINNSAVMGMDKASEAPTMNKQANSGGSSIKEALDRILDNDADLRDWLVLTNYYDVEARDRKLARHRRVKALAAERERIEEEERKLLEEEALEMGIRAPISATLKNETPLQTPVSQPSSSSSSLPATTKTTVEQNEPTPVVPAKRARSPDGDGPGKAQAQARPEKMVRRETTSARPTEPARPDVRPDDDRRGRDMGRNDFYPEPRLLSLVRRSSPPRRDIREERSDIPPPRRDYSPRRTDVHEPPRGPRNHPADKPRTEYDSYKGEGTRREYQREPSPRREYQREASPRRDGPQVGRPAEPARRLDLDLGRPGETRFFIIKSFNEENVRMAMADGVWATQSRNGTILARAFASCKNVILFFSINKSRAFQGFARMATTPSPDTPRPSWMSNVHWDSSPPFRIEWLSKVPVSFTLVGDLRNSFNEDHPVLVGKDGQEIEENCAIDLLRVMSDFAAREGGGGYWVTAPRQQQQQPQQQGMANNSPAVTPKKTWISPNYRGKRGAYRGRGRGGGGGGGGGGGSGRDSNIKREDD